MHPHGLEPATLDLKSSTLSLSHCAQHDVFVLNLCPTRCLIGVVVFENIGPVIVNIFLSNWGY